MSNLPDNMPADDRGPTYAWWVPDEAVRNLRFERQTHPDESYTQLAKRLMEENLPTIVMGAIHLALNSPDETVRLRAQTYVIDQMIGPSSKSKDNFEGGKQPWDRVLDAVLVDNPGNGG